MFDPDKVYQCQTPNCGYIYDPDKGDRRNNIAKETAFDDLPEKWHCPICGATKKAFQPLSANAAK